ncbi:MAG: DNA gyrase C-terminal beta-propeller domain-containing protein, partial [Bacteroidota bacterium]
TAGENTVVVASSGGRAVHFHEGDVRDTGRNTRGVRGIRLSQGETLVGMISVDPDQDSAPDVFTLSAKGYGKRTELDRYRVQGRGGKGLITLNKTKRTGPLAAIKGVQDEQDLMVITENGIMIRTSVDEISTMGRNTQGVRVINLKKDDTIADVTRVALDDLDDAETDDAETDDADDDKTDDEASATPAAPSANGQATE